MDGLFLYTGSVIVVILIMIIVIIHLIRKFKVKKVHYSRKSIPYYIIFEVDIYKKGLFIDYISYLCVKIKPINSNLLCSQEL